MTASQKCRLGPKAIDCLEIASFRPGSPQRIQRLMRAVGKWSWRALDKKMDELVAREYVEPLLSGTASGGLTEKGRAALAACGGRDAGGAGDDVVGQRLQAAAERMRRRLPPQER